MQYWYDFECLPLFFPPSLTHSLHQHMYTHDRLWPEFADLAGELGSEATLLAPDSGGNYFDDSLSCLWAAVADRFPGCPGAALHFSNFMTA